MKGIQYTPSRPCGEREGEVGRWKKEEGIESAKRNNGASWRVAEKEEALRRKISCFRTQQQTSFFNAKLPLPISNRSPPSDTNSIQTNEKTRLGLGFRNNESYRNRKGLSWGLGSALFLLGEVKCRNLRIIYSAVPQRWRTETVFHVLPQRVGYQRFFFCRKFSP